MKGRGAGRYWVDEDTSTIRANVILLYHHLTPHAHFRNAINDSAAGSRAVRRAFGAESRDDDEARG